MFPKQYVSVKLTKITYTEAAMCRFPIIPCNFYAILHKAYILNFQLPYTQAPGASMQQRKTFEGSTA